MKRTLTTILTVLSLSSTQILTPSCRTKKQETQSSSTNMKSAVTTKVELSHDTHDTVSRLLHIHTDSITLFIPNGHDIAPSILKFHNVTASRETTSASHRKTAASVTDSISGHSFTQSDKTVKSKTSSHLSLASMIVIITAVSALAIMAYRYIRRRALSSKSCRKQ